MSRELVKKGCIHRGGVHLVGGNTGASKTTIPGGKRRRRNMGRIPKPELHNAITPTGDTDAARHKAFVLRSAETAFVEQRGRPACKASGNQRGKTHSLKCSIIRSS